MPNEVLEIPVSPEQLDVIADHHLYGHELGLLPDERAWMLANARKKFPNCKILKAELNTSEGTWLLHLSCDSN